MLASRGGNKSRGYKYSGSNSISEVAWYYCNSGNKRLTDYDFDKFLSNEAYCNRIANKFIANRNCTHAVATKAPNELAIYDMTGNVWEWCHDNFSNYDGSYTEYGSYRVYRGGSVGHCARKCRVSDRSSDGAGIRSSVLGLRLAL